MSLWDFHDDETDDCNAVSEEGDTCILAAGHEGSHQNQLCDGTCDFCECVKWDDDAREAHP